MSPLRRRVQRARGGGYRLRLPAQERDALRPLGAQLRGVSPSDPSMRRLTPPAYESDPLMEADYREMVGSELTAERERALDTFETTLDADRLDEEQMTAWLVTINDLRLILGTRLDVTEDMDVSAIGPDDPRMPGLTLYAYLSYLLEEIVDALGAGIP